MENTNRISITSIEYKNDEKAKKDFVNIIISHIINSNLIKRNDSNAE